MNEQAPSTQRRAFGLSDVGLKRQKNEDNLLIDESLGLYVVADGMGGHKGGALASKMAVEAMQSVTETEIKEKNPHLLQILDLGYQRACKNIYHESHVEQPDLAGMGTTLVALLFRGDELCIANVGDSRVYLLREGRLWLLTEDHSLLNEHIKAGLVKDEEVSQFQAKNVITRSVGFEPDVVCDFLHKKAQVGDRYIICSDGLSGLVRDSVLVGLASVKNLQESAKLCVEEAKRNGGDDNITVLMVDCV